MKAGKGTVCFLYKCSPWVIQLRIYGQLKWTLWVIKGEQEVFRWLGKERWIWEKLLEQVNTLYEILQEQIRFTIWQHDSSSFSHDQSIGPLKELVDCGRVCMTYISHCSDKRPDKSNIGNKGFIWVWGLKLVYHARMSIALRARGSRSHCIYSWKVTDNECWCLVCFPLHWAWNNSKRSGAAHVRVQSSHFH